MNHISLYLFQVLINIIDTNDNCPLFRLSSYTNRYSSIYDCCFSHSNKVSFSCCISLYFVYFYFFSKLDRHSSVNHSINSILEHKRNRVHFSLVGSSLHNTEYCTSVLKMCKIYIFQASLMHLKCLMFYYSIIYVTQNTK